MVGELEVHIIDEGEDSTLELLLAHVEALLHEGVVAQEGRTHTHRVLLHLLTPLTLHFQSTQAEAPTFLLVEGADEDWTVYVDVHIKDLLNTEARVSQFLWCVFVRRSLECGLDKRGSSFECEEFAEFLHVEFLIYDSKTFNMTVYCALHHCSTF